MTNNNWVCEIWWQNSDGDEVSTCEKFASREEAENYGKSRMGTFNARGRLGVYNDVYENNPARDWGHIVVAG